MVGVVSISEKDFISTHLGTSYPGKCCKCGGLIDYENLHKLDMLGNIKQGKAYPICDACIKTYELKENEILCNAWDGIPRELIPREVKKKIGMERWI